VTNKKQKSNCTVGASCKSTCIARDRDCKVTTNNPTVAVATTKLKGGLKDLPSGVKTIAWGRMQLFTTGHEKLMRASDLTLLSKATDKHIDKLSKLFPGNRFETTEKGLFNYLAEFKTPIPNLVLGEDNKALGDNILKYGLAKKVTYIPRPPGSVSSTEARALFRGGATPKEMVKRGFFSSEEQAIYGQKIALDLV
jgi:hypothetical protein